MANPSNLAAAFGMQPGLDRATFLPMAGNRSQKNLQFAAPGIVYDAAKALATPYAALKGVNVTPEDAFNVAGNVMGGGLSASALLPVERGVIGANVYKNRKGSDLAEALVKRSKEKVGTTGQYVGAPSGIDSRKKYNAVVNNYLDAIKEGMPGREFYKDSSRDVYARTGNNALESDLFNQNLALLSRSNNVSGNSTMSAKGHIQAVTGDPIRTGRFPSKDSPPLQEMYDSNEIDYLGHKRDPFATQLGVHYAPERIGRGVNDMHEAELMGYPSGKVGGATQHSFMDQVRADAIKRANKEKLGGFDDWTTGTAQAAAWSGNKIRRGDISPGDAAKSYKDFLPGLEANATYEAVSSPATGHLQGLLDAPFDVRKAYTAEPSGSWNTSPSGRDIGYTAARMMPGEAVDTVGRFGAEVSPASVARPLTAIFTGADDTRQLTPGSIKSLNAVEASRAFFDAQEAGAWHKILPAKKAADYTGATIDFGRNISPDEMKKIAPLFEAKGYDIASSPRGVSVLTLRDEAAKGEAFSKDVRDIVRNNKGLFSGSNIDIGRAETGYIDYGDQWRSKVPGSVTERMLQTVEQAPETMKYLEGNPAYREAVASRNVRDLDYAAKGFGVAREDVIRARKIFKEQGFDGLRKAAKAGIVPAILVSVGAGKMLASEENPNGAYK